MNQRGFSNNLIFLAGKTLNGVWFVAILIVNRDFMGKNDYMLFLLFIISGGFSDMFVLF